MRVMINIITILILFLVLVVPSSYAGGDMTWHQVPEIKVSFAYSSKFKPEPPAEQSTLFLVNWRTKKSRNLMASCYLKAPASPYDDVMARNQLRDNPTGYVNSVIKLEIKRGRKVALISHRSVKIDDLDGVYFVLKVTSESFDETIEMNLYHLVTQWKGRQVGLICGTSLPYALKGQGSEKQIAKVVKKVEAEIKKVLRTLHFEGN